MGWRGEVGRPAGLPGAGMIMCSRLGAQWGLQPEFTGRLGANGLHPQHAAGKCINSSCSVLWQAFGGYRRLDLCQSIARPKWWPAWAAGSPSQPGEDGSAPLAPHQRRQVCLCACAHPCLAAAAAARPGATMLSPGTVGSPHTYPVQHPGSITQCGGGRALCAHPPRYSSRENWRWRGKDRVHSARKLYIVKHAHCGL